MFSTFILPSLPTTIHFRFDTNPSFCLILYIAFKCIHYMNKMLQYYDKGLNNRNVVRMVWRHDFNNNIKGSFAGNKYNVPVWVSWIRMHSIGWAQWSYNNMMFLGVHCSGPCCCWVLYALFIATISRNITKSKRSRSTRLLMDFFRIQI